MVSAAGSLRSKLISLRMTYLFTSESSVTKHEMESLYFSFRLGNSAVLIMGQHADQHLGESKEWSAMDGERGPVDSPRLSSLAEKMHDKRYRDGYVASHTRRVLAQQMRNFRGELSQSQFAELIGKRQTVISRLENPSYGAWQLRTMFEIAQKLNVAVFARFVDFPTFLKYSDDMSEWVLYPAPYDQAMVDEVAPEDERLIGERALKALFSPSPTIEKLPGASSAMQGFTFGLPADRPQVSFDAQSAPSIPANDGSNNQQKLEVNRSSILSSLQLTLP